MSASLTLSFTNDESGLEMQFTPGDGQTCDAVARIRQGRLDLTFSFLCFGYDLAEFARELELLHARYEGTASFVNQAGNVRLGCSLVHPARGIIGVVVALEHWQAWPADFPPLPQVTELRSMMFHGFTIEQSYVPQVVARIQRFLVATGISTVHPMIADAGPMQR